MKPLLGLQRLRFSEAFYRILDFHLEEGAKILDPTCGEKVSWATYFKEINKLKGLDPKFDAKKYIITFNDPKFSGQRFEELVFNKEFDAIYFDPPYIFDVSKSTDVDEEKYGGYNFSQEEIRGFFGAANRLFPKWLKKKGKLFVKHCDVFSMKDRKFHFAPLMWLSILDKLEVIDFYIIPIKSINPTAYQVKNRPCGVVNYTYLAVLGLK